MELNNEKNQIAQNEFKIKELAIKLDNLDKDTKALFEELSIDPEEIAKFINNQENFTEEGWQSVQDHKLKIDKKLENELDNIKDPRKTKSSLASLKTEANWLYVR